MAFSAGGFTDYQAPFILGNPLGFQVLQTKGGRLITPTGIYPLHFNGFLALIGSGGLGEAE